MPIYFGDLHGHSTLSDGHYVRDDVTRQDHHSNTPEEYFRYARHTAGLDIVALTDHVSQLTPETFREILQEADRWDEPGRFTAFGGYEWENLHSTRRPDPDMAHLPAYFPDSDSAVFVAPEIGQLGADRFARALASCGGLSHAGHPCYWQPADWAYDYGGVRPNAAMVFGELVPDENERYVLHHFCAEYPGCEGWHPQARDGRSIQDGLVAGCLLGFVAESDSHDGLPGTGPLTGVLAERLDRRSILAAMRRRKNYATTGARIRLEEFSLGGAVMGATGPMACGAMRLRVEGTAQIERIELVQGAVGAALPLPAVESWIPGRRHVDIETHLTLPREGGFWYVRITQEDGHQAWSSPIWLGGTCQ